MDLQNNQKRTSLAQLTWAEKKIQAFLSVITRHIGRFRGVYGFLSGIIVTVLTIAAIIWYGVLAYPLPWKVTDPRDPGFDINQFRFADYNSIFDLYIVRACALPAGTSKEYVDKVFVDIGGAKVEKVEWKQEGYRHPRLYKYTYSNFRDRFYHFLWSEMPDDRFMLMRYDENYRIEPDLTGNKFLECKDGDFDAK